MALFLPALKPAYDANGSAIPGAVWEFYSKRTTTPEALSGGGTSVTADSAGDFAAPTLVTDTDYRAILKDADGRVIYDVSSTDTAMFDAGVTQAQNLVTGDVLPGAKWRFTQTGSETVFKTIYADPELTTPLPNPVVADAEGRFPEIYLDENVTYRAQLTEADGTGVDTIDPVTEANMRLFLDPTAGTDETYGALSRAQEGAGIITTATAIESGDDSSHWQVSNGRLYPTAAGVTASLNQGPYVLSLDNSDMLNITIVADAYEATDASEFDAIIALGAATISGKTIRVRGVDMLPSQIDNHDYTIQGAPLRIETVSSGSIQYLALRDVDGLDFATKFQMRGWPANYTECVRFKAGAFDNIRFLDGTTFRHGYGASQVDYVTDFDYDEYTRVDNVQTATTSSATYALSWQDATATDGWIEFFNRGAETVHVVVGGSGVTATTGDASVAAGTKLRIASLDPTTDTHVAIISASGTSEVNARAEIGLQYYAAQAYAADGGVTMGKLHITDCVFQDLKHGGKSSIEAADFALMDCTFERIYMDIFTGGVASGGKFRFMRNVTTIPFSRSGIAEDLNGDAYDPHGDDVQMFGSGTHTFGDIIIAGNRMTVPPLRAGAGDQGAFLSDNDISPSFDGVWIINNAYLPGNTRAISVGEQPSYPIGDTMIYGNTCIPWDGLEGFGTPSVLLSADSSSHIYVGSTIAYNFTAEMGSFPVDNVLNMDDAVSKAAVFPNFADLASATDRTEIDAALKTSAEGFGLGMVATNSAIDWTTTDPDSVVLWDNVPSGAAWEDLVGQTPSATIETGLSKILNRNTGLTVVPGDGVEWRSVDTDGTTEVVGWTSLSDVIDADQFIQIRKTSSASDFTSVTASITINGFEENLTITTGKADPTAWLVNGATAGYFVDPSNVPASTNVITWKGRFYFPTSVPNNVDFYTQESGGFTGNLLSSGLIRGTVEDGTGTNLMSAVTIAAGGSIVADTWQDIEIEVNQTTEEVTVTIDNVPTVTSFTTSGNGVFQSNREVSFLANTSGANAIPNGTRVADLEVEFDGVSHKTISNDATVANADAWHNGGSFTQGGTP